MPNDPDLERMLRLLAPPLVSITTAGRAIGISKDRARDAANRGQLPTVTLGKQRKVVTGPLKRRLGLELEAAPTVASAGADEDGPAVGE